MHAPANPTRRPYYRLVEEARAYYRLVDEARALGIPTSLDDPCSPTTVAGLRLAVEKARRARA